MNIVQLKTYGLLVHQAAAQLSLLSSAQESLESLTAGKQVIN